jgi:hypothetical protein
MEPESLLPCSQDPVTDSYCEPDESSPHISIIFKLCFNTRITPTLL